MINGQMFIIEDCEDCDIYICDYTAQVQVDYCKNCRIFIGPSESSVRLACFHPSALLHSTHVIPPCCHQACIIEVRVWKASSAYTDIQASGGVQIFIRNCENCKCIIACQQYRARECVDCDTLLFASTAPVVESSKNMRFGCFRFFYFNLAQQFKSVKMSVYDNKWSEVYDFTPTDGNWSFLPLDTKVSEAHKAVNTL